MANAASSGVVMLAMLAGPAALAGCSPVPPAAEAGGPAVAASAPAGDPRERLPTRPDRSTSR